MVKDIFINLPTKDVQAARQFFTAIGFTIVEHFSNEQAICVRINDSIHAMILHESFFSTFITTPIIDAHKSTEVLLALGCESREVVDGILEKALAAGATEHGDPTDQGWMYYRRLKDLDGHVWEICHVNPADAAQVQA